MKSNLIIMVYTSSCQSLTTVQNQNENTENIFTNFNQKKKLKKTKIMYSDKRVQCPQWIF